MNFKRLTALLMALILLLSMAACGGDEAVSIGIIGGADGPTAIFVTGPDWTDESDPILDADGWYYSAEDVSLYLYL